MTNTAPERVRNAAPLWQQTVAENQAALARGLGMTG